MAEIEKDSSTYSPENNDHSSEISGKNIDYSGDVPQKGQIKTNMRTFETLRKLRQVNPEKKTLVIKEISKILSDIEESKKSQKRFYLSELNNRKIYDSEYKLIGHLKDLAISGGERFPEVSHILIKEKAERVLISWQNVSEFGKTIKLNQPSQKIERRAVKSDDILLGVNILDQQVVDVNGLKVVRVNDIAITQIKGKLSVVNIDIGSRSMFRRLGYEKFLDRLHIKLKDHPVSWSSIEPLVGSVERIHLKVPCPRVSDLNPADVAELFDELSIIERTTIFRSMKSDTAARVLPECESDVQKSILKTLKPKRIASIFEKMQPNEAAGILSGYDHNTIKSIFIFMVREQALKVEEILSYNNGTAARYMSENYITISSDLTVGTAIDYIRSLAKYPATFYYIYVVEDNNILKGVLSLKQLIIADQNTHVRDIMIKKIIMVEMADKIENVEVLVARYDLKAIPVVDMEHRIKGIVNIDDILDMMMNKEKESSSQ